MKYSIDYEEEALTELGRQEMAKAALKLPIPSATLGPPVKIHILTGAKHWYQSAFCLWSFSAASGRAVIPFIFDDGSLKLEQLEALKRLFPKLRFMGASQTLERLDEFLPRSRYPSLRTQQEINPMFKKLLDIHAGETEWRLQMDSDILFFRNPEFLIDWHDMPSCSIHLKGVRNAYICSISDLGELAGQPVRQRVNAGLLGLRSIEIDWEQMEFWTERLLQNGGKPHLMEQTLYGLHLTGKSCIALDPQDYVLLPEPPEAYECKAIMHHYIVHSKRWHFQRNWRCFCTGNIAVS